MIGAALSVAFSTAALAQSVGTAAEAKAMLEKAITELKAGEPAALAKFNKADGGFRDKHLYVYCFEKASGKFTAHVNTALMGTDVRALKDKTGKVFGEEVYKAAEEGKINEVSYMFPRPGETEPAQKTSFVTKVGDLGCGVGYFK
jgi:hypothetical protein